MKVSFEEKETVSRKKKRQQEYEPMFVERHEFECHMWEMNKFIIL